MFPSWSIQIEKYSYNSIKNWKQYKRLLLEFYKTCPFDWDDISEMLVDRYISFLEGLGYMKFTIDKHLGMFKSLVIAAESKAREEGKELYEYDEQGCPVKAKWELVASHTARRSCITNMYLSKKFSVQQMMSISGHKTESMFYKYVKLSLDEYADNVASVACDGLF